MENIVLRPDLRAALEQDIESGTKSISEIVNEAVEHYLRERQRAKLDSEIAAYEAMHSELVQKYFGQWVAIHEQKLIDRDRDRQALYRRIRAKYGKMSILLRQVMATPVEEIWIRTPSTGKIIS